MGSGWKKRFCNKAAYLMYVLDSHNTELCRIEAKITNPQVPEGKKKKLIYRQKVVQTIVIPRCTEELRRVVS